MPLLILGRREEITNQIIPLNSANFATSMNIAYSQDLRMEIPLLVAMWHICAGYREAVPITKGYVNDPRQMTTGNMPPQRVALKTDRFETLLERRCSQAT